MYCRSITERVDHSKMEHSGWKDCRWNENHLLSLIPPAWEAYRTIYNEVVSLVSKFPFRKRLVVYFVFRGTQIKVDLGDVKAAGIVCALGVGFGLGSYVIYKIYTNYIRPALNKPAPPPEKIDTTSDDDDCYFYMGSSDSSTGLKMGNGGSSEENEPSVYYSSEYGVAFGKDYRKKKVTVNEGVRLRPKRRDRQPSVQSDKDSAIGVPSELGQSFYSDAGINRDSFYSTCTAESGFENMQDSYDESTCENCLKSRLPSFKGTNSPRTYDRYNNKFNHEHDHIAGYNVHSRNSVLSSTIDEENSPSHSNSTVPRTVIDVDSPVLQDSSWFNIPDKNNSPQLVYDPSLDQSESLLSFSCASDLDSSLDSEDKSSPILTKRLQSEQQFRHSLMNKLQEWSNHSFDFVSRSPTPEVGMSGLIRRSRSLDRSMSLLTTPDVALFENETLGGKTTENLEHIEDELHGIQDEFEQITSQITALINRSNSQGELSVADEALTFCAKTLEAEHACQLAEKVRHNFDRRSSLPYNESATSSRASSVELSWDLDIEEDNGKARHRRLFQTANQSADSSENNSADHSEKNSPYRRPKQSPQRLSSVKSSDNLDVFLDSIDETAESPNIQKNKNMNIGEALDIIEYAEKEWKGDTDKATTIKLGYKEVTSAMNFKHLRKIRGDNYCAIRGCVYQILTSGHVFSTHWSGMMSIIDTLHQLYEDPTSGLSNWTFANRLPNCENKLSMICKCVLTLCSVVEELNKLSNYEQREQMTLKLLNSHPDTDLELMEGVKLLMLLKAVELYKDNQKGKDLPIFACLMFARDTSDTISKFVMNHLNPVGDAYGLEQVEMCLLGQTMGVVINVARLAQFGAEDFLCKFPDESPASWSKICLIAEDDRHYNVPTP